MKKLIFTISVVMTLQSVGYCQSDFNPIWAARFQQVLDSVRIEQNVMGAAAAVLVPGEGIWSGISGNSTPDVPLSPDMRFGIGSNTKLFIAVTIMKLQEDGALSLDDQLSQWLPTYPNIDSTITIRQLLNHQSGIYSFTDMPIFWSAVYDDTSHLWTLPEMLGYVSTQYFGPGTGWRYSNTNYILAAMIIESVTGESWVEKLHEIIFDPLDMDSTFVGAYEPPDGPIAGFQWLDGMGPWFTYPVTSYLSCPGSAGAIFSTPSEMVQWYSALFKGEIISDSSLQQILEFEPASLFGLGIISDADKTLKYPCYYHGGEIYNFLSQIIFDLRTQSVFCIIKTNYPSDLLTLYSFVNPMMSVLHNEYPKKLNDAGLNRIISPGEHLCTEEVVPQVILKNFGIDPLTTVNIQYILDNGSPITYQWSGNLDSGDTVLVSLEPGYTGNGLHTLSIFSSLPNDEVDGYLSNDTIKMSFVVTLTPSAVFPYEQDFEDLVFPPQGWISFPDVFTNWGRTDLTSYGGNSCAVKCNYWDFNHDGARYNLDLPMIDLTGASDPTLYFTYAYTNSSPPPDSMAVLISTDCGSTWQTIFYKGGFQLRTTYTITDPFFPKINQWKNEAISIAEFTGNVIIRFQAIEGSSNNLFLDDISVAEFVGVPESSVLSPHSSVKIFPNPSSSHITIEMPDTPDENSTLTIYSISGQELISQMIKEQQSVIDVQVFPQGIYFVRVISDIGVVVGKFVKQ